MHSLTDRINFLFSTREGGEILKTVKTTIDRYGMLPSLEGGVAVGFSCGADSVMLLSLLYYLKKTEYPSLHISAIHVNHLIRGESAFHDADAARDFCAALGIELAVSEIDVPSLARRMGVGIEEAARCARYSKFECLLQSRKDISTVALAHNATDNVETVIMNIVRGSGVRGMCGIPPVRDYIIRPLIDIAKGDIISALDSAGIPYVTDETNSSDEYTRNYVRHNILPHLGAISPSYERAVGRMTDNMRSAYSLISSLSGKVLSHIGEGETFAVSHLRGLHSAILADVISRLCYSRLGAYPDEAQIRAVENAIVRDNFSVSLSGGELVCQRGICFFENKSKKAENGVIITLGVGENIIHGTNCTVFVEDTPPFKDFSTNIYKFSISAVVNGDIIKDGLYLRFKRDGDAYKFGGITRKLKKVFNDRGIPPFMRESIPLICDKDGILFAAGLPVRDGAAPTADAFRVRVTVCFTDDGERKLYAALPFKNANNT